MPRELQRCWQTTDPLYLAYHDEEWGRPVRDERRLLEKVCLEGFQSGLWSSESRVTRFRG